MFLVDVRVIPCGLGPRTELSRVMSKTPEDKLCLRKCGGGGIGIRSGLSMPRHSVCHAGSNPARRTILKKQQISS